jgi:hypothetical protein
LPAYIVHFLLIILLIVDLACVQGLGDAIDKLLPHAKHMFCVWHLHANFKTRGYKGKAFKDELWATTRAQMQGYLTII